MSTTWPAALAGNGDMNGLKPAWDSVTTINVGKGFVCNDTTYDYIISSGVISIDLTASGAGGLDTGSGAVDTWYYIWGIGDVENGTTSAMFSLSSTDPTMPGAYTLKRRIGEVRTDSSGDILEFWMLSRATLRRVYWLEDPESVCQVLSNGTATTFTDVDCSSLCPPTARMMSLWVDSRVKDSHFKAKGGNHCQKHVDENRSETFDMLMDANQVIQYEKTSSGGGVNISVAGYISGY